MSARTRLAVAAVLFAGWIGWLAYLAATAARPVVLSRPQFLIADLAVIARIEADGAHPAAEVEVVAVSWPADRRDLEGRRIAVANLSALTAKGGWDGPGEYILALVRRGEQWELAATPPSPGYPHPHMERAPPPVRIYRRTSETERQLAGIQKG